MFLFLYVWLEKGIKKIPTNQIKISGETMEKCIYDYYYQNRYLKWY